MTRTPFEVPNPYSWASYLPFSGPVNQAIATSWFSPMLTVNYQGSAQIEQRVLTEVAGYGRQLGWLSEIVATLLREHPISKPGPELQRTLDDFRDALARIAEIKDSVREDAVRAAKKALERLRDDSPEAYEALVTGEANRLQSR